MTERERGVECAGAAAGDQAATAVVDRLLEEQRRKRRTDPWLEEGDPLAIVLELEDRMDAVLAVKIGDLARLPLGGDPGDHVAEEARDRTRRHLDRVPRRRAEVDRRFDERPAAPGRTRGSGSRRSAGRRRLTPGDVFEALPAGGDEGHHRPKLGADRLDRVAPAGRPQRVEARPAGPVLRHPLLGEAPVLDLLEDLPHLGADALVDDPADPG